MNSVNDKFCALDIVWLSSTHWFCASSCACLCYNFHAKIPVIFINMFSFLLVDKPPLWSYYANELSNFLCAEILLLTTFLLKGRRRQLALFCNAVFLVSTVDSTSWKGMSYYKTPLYWGTAAPLLCFYHKKKCQPHLLVLSGGLIVKTEKLSNLICFHPLKCVYIKNNRVGSRSLMTLYLCWVAFSLYNSVNTHMPMLRLNTFAVIHLIALYNNFNLFVYFIL